MISTQRTPPAGQAPKRRFGETLEAEKNVNIPIEELMQQMSSLMDKKLETINTTLREVATKKDLSELAVDFNSKMDNLVEEVNSLKEENKILKNELEIVKRQKAADMHDISRLVENDKKKNIIFKGVPDGPPMSEVGKICRERMNLGDVAVKSAKQVFKKDGKATIIADMGTEDNAFKVLKNSYKLKGTQIMVERDLTESKRIKKQIMLQIRRDILNVDKSFKVIVRDDRINIDKKWFKYDKNYNFVCGSENGYNVIQNLYKNSLKSLVFNYQEMLDKVQNVNKTLSKN